MRNALLGDFVISQTSNTDVNLDGLAYYTTRLWWKGTIMANHWLVSLHNHFKCYFQVNQMMCNISYGQLGVMKIKTRLNHAQIKTMQLRDKVNMILRSYCWHDTAYCYTANLCFSFIIILWDQYLMCRYIQCLIWGLPLTEINYVVHEFKTKGLPNAKSFSNDWI